MYSLPVELGQSHSFLTAFPPKLTHFCWTTIVRKVDREAFPMKILVVGGGGREHALVWRLAQSPRVTKIWCAPGNGGIASQAECVAIEAGDVVGLTAFAEKMRP